MEQSNQDITSKKLIDLGFTKHPQIIIPNTQLFEIKYTKGDETVFCRGGSFYFNGRHVEFMQQLKSNKE